MLIKLYTCDFPGRIFIYDNVKDVIIHTNLYSGADAGPGASVVATCNPHDPTTWIEDGAPIAQAATVEGYNFKYVDFTRDGVRCRLKVGNYAYLCNDEGKTIEKIKAN